MKKHLGKSIFLLILPMFLHAASFVHHIRLSKQQAYLHEPIQLSVDINQTDAKPILLFQFEIQKSSDYRIEQIDATYDNTLHHTKIHNLYLVYPLKTGKIHIDFKLIKRVTNDAKIAYFFSGDRDDFKKLETIDTPIALRPCSLEVLPLPQENMLVGDFNLSYEIPTHRVDAHKAIPMTITLQGKGYPPSMQDIMPKAILAANHVSLFSQKPVIRKKILAKDIFYTTIYTLAFSAAQSFDIPALTLHAFHPEHNKSYTLTLPTQHFEVRPVAKAKLVDTEDNPKALSSHFTSLKQIFLYLLVFMMGYFSAYAIKWQKKTPTKPIHPLAYKIRQSKDTKSLFQLLIAQDAPCFATCIQKLEASLYGDAKINIKEIQDEAMEKIECMLN